MTCHIFTDKMWYHNTYAYFLYIEIIIKRKLKKKELVFYSSDEQVAPPQAHVIG